MTCAATVSTVARVEVRYPDGALAAEGSALLLVTQQRQIFPAHGTRVRVTACSERLRSSVVDGLSAALRFKRWLHRLGFRYVKCFESFGNILAVVTRLYLVVDVSNLAFFRNVDRHSA